MTSLKVCFVVNSIGETSVPADIATGLVEHTTVDVDVAVWWDADPFHNDELVDVFELEAPDNPLGLDWDTYNRCRDLFAGYDLIQAHHCHSGSIAKIIAADSGIPTVSREGNTRDGFTRVGRVANGLTNPLSERLVCNSQAVYDSFTRWERVLIDDNAVSIIPNGVDIERIDSAAEREPIVDWNGNGLRVGTSGMLIDQKDHATLIEALSIASDQLDMGIELALAGDGDIRGDLESLAIRHGVRDAVHFLGLLSRDDVYGFLHELDIYAMSSRWEGFSAAALEAVASGTPCVFSDIPPFVEPYESVARFHKVGNPSDLSNQLIELANDPAERRRMGRVGRSLAAERYAIDDVVTEYETLYHRAINEG